LEQNYRSSSRILQAANAVVAKNRDRKEKALWTENPEGDRIVRFEAGNEQEEAVYILKEIRNGLLDGRRRRDHAILYRTNAQSRAIEDVFVNFSMPYRIIGGLRFYERKEVKDLVAYLRIAHNPLDSVSLKRVLNVPARGIGSTTAKTLDEEAARLERSHWDVILEAHLVPDLGPKAKTALRLFAEMVLSLRRLAESGAPVTRIAETILRETGYLSELESRRDHESESRIENIRELVTVTTKYDAEAFEPSLSGFLEQVALVSDLDSLDASADAVTLMTLHSAKGLEFPVVFLAGMEEGLFPHMRSLQSDRDLEEERRLCYVGMTRARQKLYLTHAYRRSLFGSSSVTRPSRFLGEVPKEVLEGSFESEPRVDMAVHRARSEHAPRKLWDGGPQFPAPPAADGLRPGQKVKHVQFGVGVVLSAKADGGDVLVQVAFPVVGVKKLMLSLAKLERV
jgi:DNA helicase-2/ATP-dependent DNA helicase PcrA